MLHHQLIKFVPDTKYNLCKIKGRGLNGDEISSFYQSVVNEKSNLGSLCKSESLSNGRKKPICSTNIKSIFTSQQDLKGKCHDLVNDLFRYSQNGNVSGVKYCLEKGCNINSVDAYNWTPLMSASYAGHVNVVNFLLDHQADYFYINSNGTSALSLAKKAGHNNVIDVLKLPKRKSVLVPDVKRNLIKESFFCKECKMEFQETPLELHEKSTVHLFNIQRNHKDRTIYHLTENNKGFQIMLKTGWNKERGLGAHEEGCKYPLKVRLKNDRLGIGNKSNLKAKITHFKAHDKKAVETRKSNTNNLNFKTMTKRAIEKKMQKEKQFEINFRRLFHGDI